MNSKPLYTYEEYLTPHMVLVERINNDYAIYKAPNQATLRSIGSVILHNCIGHHYKNLEELYFIIDKFGVWKGAFRTRAEENRELILEVKGKYSSKLSDHLQTAFDSWLFNHKLFAKFQPPTLRVVVRRPEMDRQIDYHGFPVWVQAGEGVESAVSRYTRLAVDNMILNFLSIPFLVLAGVLILSTPSSVIDTAVWFKILLFTLVSVSQFQAVKEWGIFLGQRLSQRPAETQRLIGEQIRKHIDVVCLLKAPVKIIALLIGQTIDLVSMVLEETADLLRQLQRKVLDKN